MGTTCLTKNTWVCQIFRLQREPAYSFLQAGQCLELTLRVFLGQALGNRSDLTAEPKLSDSIPGGALSLLCPAVVGVHEWCAMVHRCCVRWRCSPVCFPGYHVDVFPAGRLPVDRFFSTRRQKMKKKELQIDHWWAVPSHCLSAWNRGSRQRHCLQSQTGLGPRHPHSNISLQIGLMGAPRPAHRPRRSAPIAV